MRFIYNILITIVVIVMFPKFIKRLLKEPGFKERFRQSFGVFPSGCFDKVAGRGCFWVHAASVGEVVAAAPIMKELRARHPDAPLLFTVITATGYEMAQRIITEADDIAFLPLDFPWLSRKMVRRIRPLVFVNVETELWPNLLHYLKQDNIPAIMVNGRISDKSFKNYRLIKPFMREIMTAIRKFCMQSGVDARHIVGIGAAPELVEVTGNTKYEQSYPLLNEIEKITKLKEFGIEGRTPVFVAGSTYPGEEEMLLEAFLDLQKKHQRAVMIMAPRKIARAEDIMTLCANMDIAVVKRTQLPESHDAAVLLLDTIGELGQLYGVADFVYVGGSMIQRGGHNILEPAAHGKAIIHGQHLFNFKEIHALMSANNASVTVHNQEELTTMLARMTTDLSYREQIAANAARVVKENAGAAKRSVDEIEKLL